MKYVVQAGDRAVEVEVDGDRVRIDGRELHARLETMPGSPLASLVLDGRRVELVLEPAADGRMRVGRPGLPHELEVLDERTRHIRSLVSAAAGPARGGELRAPMPGLVVRVQAEPGAAVEAGTPLIVLEAMKMENQLKAPAAGVVGEVRVAEGQAVEKGEVLVTLDPPAT